MGDLIDEYMNEMEELNVEEKLLGFPVTDYPMLQQIITLKDPFDKLWLTFASFQSKENQWTKGPFSGLNAEAISEEVQNSWRTMHKLQKSFAEFISPRKVADFTKMKITQNDTKTRNCGIFSIFFVEFFLPIFLYKNFI